MDRAGMTATTALMLLAAACLLAGGMAATAGKGKRALAPAPCAVDCSVLPPAVQASCNLATSRGAVPGDHKAAATKPSNYGASGYGGEGYEDTEPRYEGEGYHHHHGGPDMANPPTSNTACHHWRRGDHDAHKYNYLPYSKTGASALLSVRWDGTNIINPNPYSVDNFYNLYTYTYPAPDADKKPGDWYYSSTQKGVWTAANDGQPQVKITKGTVDNPLEMMVHGLWGKPAADHTDPFLFIDIANGALDTDVCMAISTATNELNNSCFYELDDADGNQIAFKIGKVVLEQSFLQPFLHRSFSVDEWGDVTADVNSPLLPWRHHPVTWKCEFPSPP